MKFHSPTGQPMQISLVSGHTIVITPEGNEVPAMFRREAIARGAVAEVEGDAGSAPAPKAQFDRGQIVADALNAMLDGGAEGDFTADGKPNLTKINARVGFKVAREEADAAWAKASAPAPKAQA